MKAVMKKLVFLVVSLIPVLFMTGCGDDDEPSDVNLFIENNSPSCAIYVVKVLSPGAPSATGTNILGKNQGVRTIGGKEFLTFKIKRGEYDIYLEWYVPNVYLGYQNDRNLVNLKVNDWAKLVHEDGEHSDYRVLDGTGEVY